MKRIAVLILAAGVLLMGCGPSPVVTTAEAPTPTYQPVATTTTPVLPTDPPNDRTWVSPGKVDIKNYYPGGRAEFAVTVHNGKDKQTEFSVYYRYPDNTATGYDKPDDEAANWIIIADCTPILQPQETRDVLVALAMPKEAKTASKQWEYWVGVKDMSQKGTIRTELCVRCLVTMKQ